MSTTPPASGSRGPTPPPGGGASPLVIGKQFLKAYYNVLSTAPENIVKFYKPFSVLSQGEGSSPSAPTTLASYEDGLRLKDRLTPMEGARFDLGHGAIDAQESVGGGVLLVVTGHMVLEAQSLRRMFCHTFFLVPIDVNAKKRNYYIHNDVLRFINQEDLPALEEKEEVTPAAETSPPKAPAEETPAPPVAEPTLTNDQVKEVVVEEEAKEVAVEETKEEPPREQLHGVEETKEEPPLEEEPPVAKPAAEDSPPKEKSRKDRRRGSRGKSRSSSPRESKKASAKPKPNSWASLVASGGAPPGGQTKPKHPPPKESKSSSAAPPSPSDASAADSTKEPPTSTKEQQQHGSSSRQQHSNRSVKRDPENTLVIKNIPDGTKEADVRGVFEAFCAPSKSKILGITVAGHRGLAFVDYDSPGPVALALEKQQKERFRLNGRNLDVEQKSLDRVKRSGSRGYRSGSPGNGGRYRDRKSGRGDRSGRSGRGGR